MQDRTPQLPLLNTRPNKKSKGDRSSPQSVQKGPRQTATNTASDAVSAITDKTVAVITTSVSQTQGTPLRLSGSGTFPFPIVGDRASNKPWRPHLVGEGDFQDSAMDDPIAQAQAALAALEEGTLRLVKLVESEPTQWDRPRAA